MKMAERGITPWGPRRSAQRLDGLRGLEQTRRIDLEEWMDRLGLDAVLFPTVADVAPANADVDPQSAWILPGATAFGWPTATSPSATWAHDLPRPNGCDARHRHARRPDLAGRAYDGFGAAAFLLRRSNRPGPSA